MLSSQAVALTHDRPTVLVDLIGDLDATLGSLFADTLAKLTAGGTTDISVTTRHVAMSSSDGLAALDIALNAARSCGCAIALVAGNRRMRAALTGASIALDADAATEHARRRTRHLMIARHAPPNRLPRKP